METLSWLLSEWGSVGWVRALLILLGSLVLAKITEWVLCGVIGRLARRTRSTVDDEVIGLLHRPVFLTVLVSGLLLALAQLAPPEDVALLSGRLLRSLLVLIWLVALVRISAALLRALSGARPAGRTALIDERTVPLLDNSARVVLIAGAAYFTFVVWNIDLTAWLASAGIVGIAVGFAAKDTLGNLFAGVFILFDRPYKVGDFIVLDGGERGQVTHIGIRSTRLLTRDDVEIIIPNSVIGGSKIINESGGPWKKYRLRIGVGVAYGSDIELVRSLLEQIADDQPGVCEEPERRVRFRRFGDSSLDFELLVWIEDPVLRGQVQDALLSRIYHRFQEQGVEIPFPQRDLHLRSGLEGLSQG